jgi:copper resistance protein B
MFRYFALYVENYWVNEYGDTAELSRISGDSTEDTGVVVGVRLIF